MKKICKHNKSRCSKCSSYKMRLAYKNLNAGVNPKLGDRYEWRDFYNFVTQNNEKGKRALFNFYKSVENKVFQMEFYDRESDTCIAVFVNGQRAPQMILDKINNK